VLNNSHLASIAKTIVARGHNLGLNVIAEGMETEGPRNYLAHSGCELFQGYLFSRALPMDAFQAFVLAVPPVGNGHWHAPCVPPERPWFASAQRSRLLSPILKRCTQLRAKTRADCDRTVIRHF
jgi:hypothetical protein